MCVRVSHCDDRPQPPTSSGFSILPCAAILCYCTGYALTDSRSVSLLRVPFHFPSLLGTAIAPFRLSIDTALRHSQTQASTNRPASASLHSPSQSQSRRRPSFRACLIHPSSRRRSSLVDLQSLCCPLTPLFSCLLCPAPSHLTSSTSHNRAFPIVLLSSGHRRSAQSRPRSFFDC